MNAVAVHGNDRWTRRRRTEAKRWGICRGGVTTIRWASSRKQNATGACQPAGTRRGPSPILSASLGHVRGQALRSGRDRHVRGSTLERSWAQVWCARGARGSCRGRALPAASGAVQRIAGREHAATPARPLLVHRGSKPSSLLLRNSTPRTTCWRRWKTLPGENRLETLYVEEKRRFLRKGRAGDWSRCTDATNDKSAWMDRLPIISLLRVPER